MNAIVYRKTVPRRPGRYETDVCFDFIMAHERGDHARIEQLRKTLVRFMLDRLRTGSGRPFLPQDSELSETDT